MKCELRWCRSGEPAEVHVGENIGDGCWRVVICQECATALGLREEQDLPGASEVEKQLRKHYKKTRGTSAKVQK